MAKVSEIMVKEVVTIDASKSVNEAAVLMDLRDVGCLLVEEGGKVKGIITERDIVRRVIALGVDPKKVRVADIMSSPLVVVEPDAMIEEAAKVMVTYKIRRLPVVKEGKLVGLITASDLASYLSKLKGLKDPLLKAIARYKEPPKEGPYA
jgi:CBS domain-containing protein